MSLIGLASSMNDLQSTPNPTPSTTPRNLPAAVSSPNGGTAQGGIDSAVNQQTPAVSPTPPMAGISVPNPKASDTIPSPWADVQALIKSAIDRNQGQYQDIQNRDNQNWQTVNDLQKQMANAPTPQMKPVALNPLTALLTALSAGAMQNRFTPQAQEFTGNLLNGINNNNQIDYQNQATAHQNKLALLGSAVTSAKDQATTDRYLGQQNLRDSAGQLENLNRSLGQFYTGQGHDQAKIQASQISADAKTKIGEMAGRNADLRDFVLRLNHAGPEERVELYKEGRDAFPQIFGNMTDAAIDKSGILTPDETMKLAKGKEDDAYAKKAGVQAWQIQQLTPAQKDAYVAKAQKARADSQAVLQNAASLGSLRNSDIQLIQQRVAHYEPEFQARVAKEYADAYHLANLAGRPGQEALQITRQLQTSADQRASLANAELGAMIKRNGGSAPDGDVTKPAEWTPEFAHYQALLQEQGDIDKEMIGYRDRLSKLDQARAPATPVNTQAYPAGPGVPTGQIGKGAPTGPLFGISANDATEAGLIAQARDSLSRHTNPKQVQAIRGALSQMIRAHRGK